MTLRLCVGALGRLCSEQLALRIVAWVLYVGGSLLLTVSFWLLFSFATAGETQANEFLLWWIVFAFSSVRLLRIAQLSPSEWERTRALDCRPPVLYLRRFAFDLREWQLLPPEIAEFEFDQLVNGTNFEEYAHRMLRHLGPVVCLASPDDPVGAGAALRMSAPPGWEARVLQLLNECSYAVIVAANTKAVMWEVEQAFQRLERHQILLILPFGTTLSDEYE